MQANPVISATIGFIILMLLLVELYGFSAANAIFALPVVLGMGLLMVISNALALLLSFFLGALVAGPLGLLMLGIVLFLITRSAAGINAQGYLSLAVFLIVMLLLV